VRADRREQLVDDRLDPAAQRGDAPRLKALLTSLRTRVWSGGSMTSIERIVCAPC